MTGRIAPVVFDGEAPDGTRVRVVWDVDGDPEVVAVFTFAPGSRATWSRPLHCHKVDR
jgi:hypothetical protein